MPKNKRSKTFHVFLLKPSHYDDDGYPITWTKTLIPSNSLAAMHALCTDSKQREVFGKDVDVKITIIDETNTRISPRQIMSRIQKENAQGFIAMVGVQTNQFPRTMELCRQFAKYDIPVCVGGFHVAGYLATMKELPKEAIAAQQEHGVSFFAGEGEDGRVEEVLLDAFHNRLKPLYNHLGKLPQIAGGPPPFLPQKEVAQTLGYYTAFDLGRGCPFNCSFCTIINVHGHESRFRTADDLEKIIRANHKIGVHRFFITDDNIARNKNWEAFFDKLHSLRKEGIRIRILAQVDTASYKIPGFIKKAFNAGVDQLFIGMESINPDNLAAVNKKQNKTATYKAALLAWKQYPIVITAAYIVGLPADTPESVRQDIETIKKELPIDTIYFTNLTPLPGSMDHKRMVEEGEWMSNDLNQYDTHHCVSKHPQMSATQWKQTNRAAWKSFYSFDHMVTILKRMVSQKSEKKLTTIYRLTLYSYFGCHSSIHPIDGGVIRKKYRADRRPGLPKENPLIFYPRHLLEICVATLRMGTTYYRLWGVYKKLVKDPQMTKYTDQALSNN